jgi:hypothetical protein
MMHIKLKMMKKVLYVFVAFVLLTGCSTSARIEKSWRDPEVTVDVSSLNKVLVVALLNNDANRRSTEDKLSKLLNGKGVPSYNYLTKDITQQREAIIREKVKGDGFDGIVIMRLADVDKDMQYEPGNYPIYYGKFWGYYWNAWSAYYDPEYYKTTKRYNVETNVYSLRRDKLIWSGVTSSVDASNVNQLIEVAAMTVYKQMQREGFITGI